MIYTDKMKDKDTTEYYFLKNKLGMMKILNVYLETSLTELTESYDKHANLHLAYIVYDENEIATITVDILNEIITTYGKEKAITLYTNAGVDLHSSTKGLYKNIRVIKVSVMEDDNGGFGYNKKSNSINGMSYQAYQGL